MPIRPGVPNCGPSPRARSAEDETWPTKSARVDTLYNELDVQTTGLGGMRDPHVERLVYKITNDASVHYDDPEEMNFSNDMGLFRKDN